MLPDYEKLLNNIQELKNLLAEMNKYRFAEQFLDNEELCALFKISTKTAESWRRSGQLPYAQLGKKIYYRLSDIENLFQAEFNKPKRPQKTHPKKRLRLIKTPNTNGFTITV